MPGRLQYYDDEVVFDRRYVDAFNRVRVGAPYTLADHVHKYEIDALEYTTSVVGTGDVSHVAAYSAIKLDTGGAANGATAQIQTNDFYRYQAGKSMDWTITAFHADIGQTNQRREWGLFNTATNLDDGLMYRLDGQDLQIVQRTTTSGTSAETVVYQSAWNVDPLDGSGPSGETLDITKGNIYGCNFQWLGVGDVYWFVNGIHVHTIENHNQIAAPYMRTAQLPLTCRITNRAASTRSSFHYICSTVVVNGGSDPPEYAFSHLMPSAISCATAGAATYLFSIRPKTNYPGAGSIANRMTVLPVLASFQAESQRGAVEVWFNRSLTGATYATDPSTSSGVEVDTAASANSGGTLVTRFMITSNEAYTLQLGEYFRLNGRKLRAGDRVTFLGQGESGASADIRGSVTWREVR